MGGLDLLGSHAGEIIIAEVEVADMVEAQPAPVARPVEIWTAAISRGRAELARLGAAGMGAGRLFALDAAVKPALLSRARHLPPFLRQSPYIGDMPDPLSGGI